MRKLKIPVGEVHTSMFNRAVETGKLLGFGEVKPSIDFAEGGLVVTSIENNRRAQAQRKLAATPPPPGTNIIVVTHRPNILDAFGKDWFEVKEGKRRYSSRTGPEDTSSLHACRRTIGASSHRPARSDGRISRPKAKLYAILAALQHCAPLQMD